MNMRWWITLSVVAVLGLVTVPVLAQPYTMPGGGHMGQDQRTTGQPLSIEQAGTIARRALDRWGYAGLVPGHIMEFSNHFYVAAKFKTSGQGAFEFLIDRYTGAVHPEPQSMMWNTQFGHMTGRGGPARGTTGPGMMTSGDAGSMMGSGGSTMMGPGGPAGGAMGPGMMSPGGAGGMMGPGSGSGMMGPGYGPMGPGTMGSGGAPGMTGPTSRPSGTPSVTLAQAKTLAQKFLDSRFPGTKLDDATAFPGYYTLDVSRNGKVIGMLSVNGYSGQVWYHGWHGTFIEEKELD